MRNAIDAIDIHLSVCLSVRLICRFGLSTLVAGISESYKGLSRTATVAFQFE